MDTGEKIVLINIEDQMKSAYIDYSMSVIVSRALPDVRDGLKPVHRRVLYGMYDLGITHNKAHKKSARIVGEVLGKYHPHGDSSVYDTMVRMAQDWSLRYPLIDGQGNFGSSDGDNPAAMRYTEARMSRIADEILADIDKETVDFQNNFDDTLQEPKVMPTKLPNLLINGSSGIAVGMATNMLPHNLTEVIDGVNAYIDNHDITIGELCEFIKAPDFPTGGIIYGMEGIREAFETGRGRVVLRGRATIENMANDKSQIIVTEIPYQVTRSTIIIKAAELLQDKKIDGISDIRDESDRDGTRIVFELKRDANPQVVLSLLYKYTPLQTSYGVNNICLVNGRPRLLNLKDLISEFVKFRLEVILRRSIFELRKAKERAHILKALLAALDRLDAVIAAIRASKTTDEAKTALMQMDFSNLGGDALDLLTAQLRLDNDRLDDIQAKAILEMRLQRLTGLERDKIRDEFIELMKVIIFLQEIIDSEARRKEIIKEELANIKDKFGDKRRTDIEYADGEIRIEDLIDNEDLLVTISSMGYIKTTPLNEYRAQSRGGKGSKSSGTREEDFIEQMFMAKAHNYMLMFTESGRCFWIRVYELPKGAKTGKGRVIQNLLSIPKEDKVRSCIVIENLQDPEFLANHFITFCTKDGIIKKTPLDDYSRPRSNGINALTIREGDQLIEAKLTNGKNEIILASRSGKAIRFNESDVRSMGRNASGVRGMNIDETVDAVIGMICVDVEDNVSTILAVAENGLGKRTELDEYRVQTRGGKGIKTLNVTEKTGALVALKSVTDNDDLMIINKSGIAIRLQARTLPTSGRNTQGVKLIKLNGNDAIADVSLIVDARLNDTDEEEDNIENLTPNLTEGTEANEVDTNTEV